MAASLSLSVFLNGVVLFSFMTHGSCCALISLGFGLEELLQDFLRLVLQFRQG